MAGEDDILTLEVGGKKLRAVEAIGRAAVGELFSFRVDALGASDTVVDDLLGKAFELTLAAAGGKMTVHGVVMSVESIAAPKGTRFFLDLEPEVAPLTVGKDSYVFQKMTVVEIIKDVLESNGIEHVEWHTSGSYDKRVYTAQYGESDWSFVERMCADEGIYYWFDFTDDGTFLVFADDSTGAPELPGGAKIVYRETSQLTAAADWVSSLKLDERMAPGAVTLRDYHHEKPKLKLESKAKEEDGTFEMYDFPGRFEVPAAGDARAKVQLQAFRALRQRIEGDTGTLRLRHGMLVEIDEHPVDAVNGRYLCLGVEYEARDFRGASAEPDERRRLEIRWTGIPAKTPYRMPAWDTVNYGSGPQTGVVVGPPGDEIHVDDTGRIRVQFYWDRGGRKDHQSSTPMRVGQVPMAGSMILPRIGWDVFCEHHEGDVDDPFVISHLYDGLNKVPYALPANKTRTAWQTATTPGGGSVNEIRYEDKAGSEEVFMNASKDMKVVVGDNKQKKVGANHTHKIGANHDVKVGSNSKHEIGSNQTVNVGAAEMLTVSGNRAVGVGGSLTSTIGALRMVSASKGYNIDADGGRSVTVGGAMMAVAAMGVSRSTLGSFSATIGGAWISAAAMGAANATLGAGAETVGGAKVQAAGKSITLNVKGVASATVGGAFSNQAGANVAESSGGPLSVTVGGAFVANAPSVEIEAQTEIKITCGGSTLTIKDSVVEIESPSLASPGATVNKDGSTIHHNP